MGPEQSHGPTFAKSDQVTDGLCISISELLQTSIAFSLFLNLSSFTFDLESLEESGRDKK